jgi:hypothetical protein
MPSAPSENSPSSSRPRAPPKINVPALVGGGASTVIGVSAAFRFRDWLWSNKWIILLVLILIMFTIFMIVKAFFVKEEPREEE